MQVAVTGASGKTGKLVVKRLLQSPDQYAAVAVVRSDKVCVNWRTVWFGWLCAWFGGVCVIECMRVVVVYVDGSHVCVYNA